jgi:hypothetical protein
MKTCPSCRRSPKKIIMYGVPLLLCEACELAWGAGGYFASFLPLTGKFKKYEKSYLLALWHWVIGKNEIGDIRKNKSVRVEGRYGER